MPCHRSLVDSDLLDRMNSNALVTIPASKSRTTRSTSAKPQRIATAVMRFFHRSYDSTTGSSGMRTSAKTHQHGARDQPYLGSLRVLVRGNVLPLRPMPNCPNRHAELFSNGTHQQRTVRLDWRRGTTTCNCHDISPPKGVRRTGSI